MSSSPKHLRAGQLKHATNLLQVLDQVPDPRDRRGRRHNLAGVIAVALTAVLAGARSYMAVAEWAHDLTGEQLARLGLTRPEVPEESTFRRILSGVDAALLDAVIGVFMWSRIATIGDRRIIALDGKTVRGARNAGSTAPHLVGALDHHTGAVVGQMATATKSNEIPTVQALLRLFDLAGTVITVDAMHTQTATAAQIVAAGADYVFTIKGNQPKLHKACKQLPWNDITKSHTQIETGHGRRVRRTIKVVAVPAWITFPGATQIAQLRRTVTRGGKKTVEVVYLITSANHHTAPPATLASWIQGHWAIENRLHWVRDVTYGEDNSQTRTGNGPQVMATLRNTAISLLRLAGHTNIAKAHRHHNRNPNRPIKLLLAS
jgi:predicted transposase YbfD/YdcC